MRRALNVADNRRLKMPLLSRERVGLSGENRRNSLKADTPKLLPQLPSRLSRFMSPGALDRAFVRRTLLPLRQEANAAFRAGKILDDTLFRKHGRSVEA
jgi:hypothetical protein